MFIEERNILSSLDAIFESVIIMPFHNEYSVDLCKRKKRIRDEDFYSALCPLFTRRLDVAKRHEDYQKIGDPIESWRCHKHQWMLHVY